VKKIVVFLFVLVIVLPLGWFLFNEFEGKKPTISVQLPSSYFNLSFEMPLRATDRGTGLRSIRVSLNQAGNEKVLLNKLYDPIGYKGFFIGSDVHDETFKIPVEALKYGMQDGEAVLKISVADYSWWNWNQGNRVVVEKKVIIDTKPPQIEILTTRHNVTRGGAGLIIYRLSEENIKSGVQVGPNFFPGYSGMFKDKALFAAFFALTYEQGPGVDINVKAEDPAGNISKRGFYHYIRDQKFKADIINLPDSFLDEKISEFDLGKNGSYNGSAENPMLAKFLHINNVVRKDNINTVLEPVKLTANELMWKGVFLRLPGSANRAGFADHRTYKYNGKEVDRQVHMGVDLASLTRAEVPAANRGRVLATERVGIFGNTVLIDHGFGLTTLYAHLSSISVSKGDMVEKGQIIGKTGITGLAVGDHLHFGVAVKNVFVNPLEWWDPIWIQNNILQKIEEVETGLK